MQLWFPGFVIPKVCKSKLRAAKEIREKKALLKDIVRKVSDQKWLMGCEAFRVWVEKKMEIKKYVGEVEKVDDFILADFFRECFFFYLDMPLSPASLQKIDEFHAFIPKALSSIGSLKAEIKGLLSKSLIHARPTPPSTTKTSYDSFFYNLKTLSETLGIENCNEFLAIECDEL